MIKHIARWTKFHWMLHKKHHKSMKLRQSISNSNIPIPWYTYGAIEFLSRINAKTVFEYGCGNSTLWWAKRSVVYFIEHDFEWFKKIIEKCPETVTGYHAEQRLSVCYVNGIEYPGTKYDVIVIDGELRTQCTAMCIDYLTEDGVIVLDNVEWNAESKKILLNAGFVEIPFKGIGPINEYEWTTSIFVKNLNLFK